MKIQNRIRMQMVMVGLGAALLMAGSARAQQDVDPTYFDVNPGARAVSEHVRTAQNTQAAVGNVGTEDLAAVASGDSTLETATTRIAIVDLGVVLVLFGGVVSIAMYAMAATRRERGFQVRRGNAPYSPISAATAQ